jgi:putative flippase GtrA
MIEKILHHDTTQQFVKYAFVAGGGLVIDFGTVIFTKQILHFHYLVAACCGFLLGLIFTYFFSNKFVFGMPKGDQKKVFVLFGIVGLVGLGLLNLIMWILTGNLGVNYIVAKALATIVVFVWNFFARRSLFHDEDLERIQVV